MLAARPGWVLTCRARCTASAKASFLIPPGPMAAGPGAPGGGTALYSDISVREGELGVGDGAGELGRADEHRSRRRAQKRRGWRDQPTSSFYWLSVLIDTKAHQSVCRTRVSGRVRRPPKESHWIMAFSTRMKGASERHAANQSEVNEDSHGPITIHTARFADRLTGYLANE